MATTSGEPAPEPDHLVVAAAPLVPADGHVAIGRDRIIGQGQRPGLAVVLEQLPGLALPLVGLALGELVHRPAGRLRHHHALREEFKGRWPGVHHVDMRRRAPGQRQRVVQDTLFALLAAHRHHDLLDRHVDLPCCRTTI
jgi:hypothetical protein